MNRKLYIKANRKKYKGFWGPNGYYSFEYGYINSDGSLKPAGTEADALTFNVPVRCDYIDKDVMRIWSDDKNIRWEHDGLSDAVLIGGDKE